MRRKRPLSEKPHPRELTVPISPILFRQFSDRFSASQLSFRQRENRPCRSSASCQVTTQSATTQRYANLDNDPLKKASEHIGGRLAAAIGDTKAPRANVTSLAKAKRSKNRRGYCPGRERYPTAPEALREGFPTPSPCVAENTARPFAMSSSTRSSPVEM